MKEVLKSIALVITPGVAAALSRDNETRRIAKSASGTPLLARRGVIKAEIDLIRAEQVAQSAYQNVLNWDAAIKGAYAFPAGTISKSMFANTQARQKAAYEQLLIAVRDLR